MNFLGNMTGEGWAYHKMGDPVHTPLLLLHGFCADSSVWADMSEQLAQTGLIMLDLPGFGRSAMPLSADMHGYAETVYRVLEREGIERCVLVGHSMGGYAALEFAARWPERLAGLGLVNSHPYADTPERKEIRLRSIEMLRAGKRDLYVSQFVPQLFAPSKLASLGPWAEKLVEIGQNTSAGALEQALLAMLGRQDRQEVLARINCPVLFLLGGSDALVPPEMGLPPALLPDMAVLHLLERTGHMAMLEAPRETANILNDFCKLCAAHPL